MQFMDFPGLSVLSHQRPGALHRKVLEKDSLVLGLKGGLLAGLSWVFPSICASASMALQAPSHNPKETPPP